MMGDHAAEELIFGSGKITSGASLDLKQAINIAAHMVKEWSVSEQVGLFKKTLQDSYERIKSFWRCTLKNKMQIHLSWWRINHLNSS